MYFDVFTLLAIAFCILIGIPFTILYMGRLFKHPIASWQAFLCMFFALLCNQLILRLACWYPWVLFHYQTETYSGPWAHQSRFIDVHEKQFLVFEGLGFLCFFLFPYLWRSFFKKYMANTIPIKTLILLLPLYFIATTFTYPNYRSVKTTKFLMTKDNF